MPASARQPHLVAPLDQPASRRVAGQLGGLVALVVGGSRRRPRRASVAAGALGHHGGEVDGGRSGRGGSAVPGCGRGRGTRRCRPRPVIGDTIAPMMAAPRPAGTTTSPSTRRHTAGSRITPARGTPRAGRPRTAASPAAPGRRPGGAGRQVVEHRRSEMNDRSATTSGNGSPRSPGARSRTLVRSCTSTRVGPQPLVELAVADVDRHHPPRPAGAGSR